jgi:hypothetical protein
VAHADPRLPNPGLASSSPEEVDEELLDLPAPPRAQRFGTLVLMALVAVLAMALAASLRSDLRYFFERGEPVDLGTVTELAPATLRPNSYVRVEGVPMLSRAVGYRRIVTGASYQVFPLAGQRQVYVQVPQGRDALAGTVFTGRLVTFGQLGARADALRTYLSQRMDLPVSDESFLVLAGEPPGSAIWAILLALFAVFVVVLDAVLILRWFRPLPTGASSE